MSDNKKRLLGKIGFGISLVTIVAGIIISVMGNMLGVWIAGFATYGAYSSYKRLRASNERKRT